MPVFQDEITAAFDHNEQVLELVVAGSISELDAWLLFIDPGVSSEDKPATQGWHRVYPPLSVTEEVARFLREYDHHIYQQATSTKRRARECVHQKIEELHKQQQETLL